MGFFGGTRRSPGGSSQVISTGGMPDERGGGALCVCCAAKLVPEPDSDADPEGSGVLRQPACEPSANAANSGSIDSPETLQIPRVNWPTMAPSPSSMPALIM